MKKLLSLRKVLPFPKNELNKKVAINSSEYHCLQIVKKFDYENFLSTLFIQNDSLRRTAFAVRAFNVEIAQIRDLTKTDDIAQMRFQFWEDLIEDVYRKRQNDDYGSRFANFPIALELQKILQESGISKHWFKKILSTRRDKKYLSNYPFRTMEELEEYCQSTVSSIYYLLNERTIELTQDELKRSPGYRISLDHIGSHFGKAQGLCNILRGLIHNAKYRRCYVPNDILVKTNCTHEDILRGMVNDHVQDAVFEIAAKANQHLDKSLDLLHTTQNIGRDRQIYLTHLPIKDYLKTLQKLNFNPFDPQLNKRNGFLVFKIWLQNKKF